MLPELAEETAAVHEEFKPERAPEIQQSQVEFDLAHADFGVPHIAAVHSARIKIQKRIGVQVPAMRGVAERTVIRVVRRGDEDGAAGFGYAMKFLHGGDDVRDVFDDVFGADLVERIIAKGQAAMVEMAEDIGSGGWSRDILSAHSLRRECAAKQLLLWIWQAIFSFLMTRKMMR